MCPTVIKHRSKISTGEQPTRMVRSGVLRGQERVGGGGERGVVGVVVGGGVDELVGGLAGGQQAGRRLRRAVEQAGLRALRHARRQDERRAQRRLRAQRHAAHAAHASHAAARRQQTLRLGRGRRHAPPLLVRCGIVCVVSMVLISASVGFRASIPVCEPLMKKLSPLAQLFDGRNRYVSDWACALTWI